MTNVFRHRHYAEKRRSAVSVFNGSFERTKADRSTCVRPLCVCVCVCVIHPGVCFCLFVLFCLCGGFLFVCLFVFVFVFCQYECM